MMINANVEIKNMMHGAKPGWVVARAIDGELWYWGNYGEDKDRAEKASKEIGGVVVRYDGVRANES